MNSSTSITAVRDPGWEYRLAVLLLRSGLHQTRALHRATVERIAGRRNVLDKEKSLALAKRLLEQLTEWSRRFAQFYPAELQAAWGLFGKEGDADAIIQACAKIVRHFEELIAWETAAAEATHMSRV